MKFEVGDKVTCINAAILSKTGEGPALKPDQQYVIKAETTCACCGKQHLDVGLVSALAFVSCLDGGKKLENGDKIHWCHPSRFIPTV